jgi:zinc D-Ala-D-Ala carboxypeptidase
MIKFTFLLTMCTFFVSCTNNPSRKTIVSESRTVQDSFVVADVICPSKEFLVGQIKGIPQGFVQVSKDWSRREIFIDSSAYNSFQIMAEAARADGVDLVIISGYRSFFRQKSIWDRKWDLLNNLSDSLKVLKILEFSSMPGISRHHWGTDIDLNSLENEYFQTGYGLKVYNWLVKNALVYGFFQPYTDKEGGRNGFEEEKWHWSYFPLADDYLHCYSVDTGIREFLIGFKGNEYYQKLNILEDYVKGVEER